MEFNPQSSTRRWALAVLGVLALGGGFIVGAVDADDERPRRTDRRREVSTPSVIIESPAGSSASPGVAGGPGGEEGKGDEGSEDDGSSDPEGEAKGHDEGDEEYGSSDPEGKAKGHDGDHGNRHEGSD